MATKYLYRVGTGHNYQYKVDDGKPFYTALIAQGFSEAGSRQTGKTIFPGGKGGAAGDTYEPVY